METVKLTKMLNYVTQDFEVMPRRIHIDQIDIQNFTPGYFPEVLLELIMDTVEIDVVCGAGTYIRSIARECGEALVVPPEHLHSSCILRNPVGEYCAGGTLVKLERTRSGAFSITDSLSIDKIRDLVEIGEFPLQPIETMLQHLPLVEFARQTTQRWLHGGTVTISADQVEFGAHERHKLIRSEPIRIYCQSSSQLLGIAQVDTQDQHGNFILRKRLFV
ncbi:hypothetical protein PsorP6_009583 [Peronosclerospora sorghi]|uniref:Uncharacterized protein n=1 Tax=Peronosclerospora sorghi TaxID=230839 RepID=A0ACC0W217_9STRA|nr:hypothetical protein PsorP6_009583 [Peronosclerospora sorghi]